MYVCHCPQVGSLMTKHVSCSAGHKSLVYGFHLFLLFLVMTTDAAAFDQCNHCGLSAPPLIEAGFSRATAKGICEKIGEADDKCARGEYDPCEHFDRTCADGENHCNSLTRGLACLNTRIDFAEIQVRAGHCEEALDHLAYALHAVQDLAIHSNYCQLCEDAQSEIRNDICFGRNSCQTAECPSSPNPFHRVFRARSGTGPGEGGTCKFLPCSGDLGDCISGANYPHCDPGNLLDHLDPTPCQTKSSHDFSRCAILRLESKLRDRPDLWDAFKHCRPEPPPPPPPQPCYHCVDPQPYLNCFPVRPEGITSGDPNGKFGPAGSTTRHHISLNGQMSYLVAFENDANAAPAHEVLVRDSIDEQGFDLSAFRFQYVVIGERVIPFDSPTSSFEKTIDLRPSRNALVRCSGRVDSVLGEIVAQFQTLDPSTGLPSDDPLGGFLPPNRVPPEGEAGIAFSIVPQAGVQSGYVLRNAAVIRFDSNAPIVTPTWANTVDTAPPESRVLPLPAASRDSVFSIQWEGSDDASGVSHFDIYAAVDSSEFSVWRSNTVAVSDSFVGSPGHRYRFFSVADDSTRNTEAPPESPDAFIKIDRTTDVLASVVSARTYDTSITVEWRLSHRLPRVTVDSNRNSEGWTSREQIDRGAHGMVTFVDRSVAGGDSIGYRLRGQDLNSSIGEIWVAVPIKIEFGVRLLTGNPSLGKTVVRCGVPQAGRGRLSVYDVAGRRVCTVPFVATAPRWLDIDLRAALGSGVYFVQLDLAGRRSLSTRVVVLR